MGACCGQQRCGPPHREALLLRPFFFWGAPSSTSSHSPSSPASLSSDVGDDEAEDVRFGAAPFFLPDEEDALPEDCARGEKDGRGEANQNQEQESESWFEIFLTLSGTPGVPGLGQGTRQRSLTKEPHKGV